MGQPGDGPTDEVGNEDDYTLLQVDRRFRADLDPMWVEDTFTFLDASFDGLPAVVMLEPTQASSQ